MIFIPDIPRIITAVAEWASCLALIFFLEKRYGNWTTVLLSAAALAAMIAFHLLAGILPVVFWIPGMVAAVGLMFFFILITCKVSLLTAGCWTAQAFIMAEFAASLEWQLYYAVAQEFNLWDNLVAEYLFAFIIYVLLFSGAFLLEHRYKEQLKKLELKSKDLMSFAGIGIAAFIASNISFITKDSPFGSQYAPEIFYIRTLVDLCGLILLYSYREQKLWSHARNELQAMQNVLDRHYEQYVQSKESIELVNRRYHDLKHQLAIIRNEENPDKKAEYLDSIERDIRSFEIQNKAGNNVLDVVLTSKRMVCAENSIIFTCVADGALIDFMSVMDICSLFGNALDNAIESVKRLKDKDKRLIKLAIYSQRNLLLIKVENYFEHNLVIENGIIKTTKADSFSHGYGIKSMKSIIEKYGGNLKITTEQNWFTLCALIPL